MRVFPNSQLTVTASGFKGAFYLHIFSRVLLDLHQLDETEVCLGKTVKAAASLIARKVALSGRRS